MDRCPSACGTHSFNPCIHHRNNKHNHPLPIGHGPLKSLFTPRHDLDSRVPRSGSDNRSFIANPGIQHRIWGMEMAARFGFCTCLRYCTRALFQRLPASSARKGFERQKNDRFVIPCDCLRGLSLSDFPFSALPPSCIAGCSCAVFGRMWMGMAGSEGQHHPVDDSATQFISYDNVHV